MGLCRFPVLCPRVATQILPSLVLPWQDKHHHPSPSNCC
uniref:Uncharacterized protein n=1 Tax=Rhizophora mucronata TaxID=61149 RepID=A0A2P2IPB2_RHIMU